MLEDNKEIGGLKNPPYPPTASGIAEIAEPAEITEEEPEETIQAPKKGRGRPKKPIDKEAEEFKKRVAEETEKAYKEVIETKIKSNIKKELRKKALEDGERFKDPEPDNEKKKKVLTEKQIESLNKGREIAISKTREKREVNKKIDAEVKTIKEAKKNIRKTLLVDKIREQIDGLDSEEDEEEIVIQKKPKAKPKIKEPESLTPPTPMPRIIFY